MPKRKMTTGVLARDTEDEGSGIVFFIGLKRNQVRRGRGFWRTTNGVIKTKTRDFTEDWKKDYDLKPPRRGTAFEVEIEL